MPKATGRKLDSPPLPTPESPGPGRRLSAGSQPAPLKRSGKSSVGLNRTLMIGGGIIIVLIVIPLIAILLHSARARKSTKPAEAPATPAVAAKVETVSSPVPTAEPSATTSAASEVEAAEIRTMVLALASQISQKSGYEFGPEFLEHIRARSHEYASEKALLNARQYRREINKSFHDEGLNPLIGYVLAMSRSRFDVSSSGDGVGIWQMPAAVARSQGYLRSGEDSAKLNVPEESAQITASYTRQLLSAFEPEDFMYAIACFGMTLQEAGQLQARLVTTMPQSKSRRDIQKIIDARVLSGEQVDNMARFFAAGIVGENPQKFGLVDSQRLSSLY